MVGNRNFYREYDTELGRTRFIWDSDNRFPVVPSKMNQIIREYPERKITLSNNSIKALGGSQPDEYEVLLEIDIKRNNHKIIFSSQN